MGVKLMLVVDDLDYVQVYRQWFENVGYEVLVAADGEAALEIIRSTVPDLIYLDRRMPTLDGVGFLAAVRGQARTAHVPVVILSDYDEPELRERGLELGGLEWLVKADVTCTALARRTADLMRAEAAADAGGLRAGAAPPPSGDGGR